MTGRRKLKEEIGKPGRGNQRILESFEALRTKIYDTTFVKDLSESHNLKLRRRGGWKRSAIEEAPKAS
jgi:hypothetical protein